MTSPESNLSEDVQNEIEGVLGTAGNALESVASCLKMARENLGEITDARNRIEHRQQFRFK